MGADHRDVRTVYGNWEIEMSVIQKSRDGNVVLLYRGDSPNLFCRVKKWLGASYGDAHGP